MELKVLFMFIDILSAAFCFMFTLAIFQCKICGYEQIKKINLSIGLVALFSALWSLCLGLSLFFMNSHKTAEFFMRLSWLGTYIVASYTFSTLLLTKNKNVTLITLIQYVIATIFSVLAFTPVLVKKYTVIYPLSRVMGPVEPIARIWITVSIIYMLFLCAKHYRSLLGLEKIKFQYYIMSLVLYGTIGGITVGLLPLFDIPVFIHIGPAGTILWVLALLYAIQQHKLLDIEVLFCNVIRYSIFIIFGVIINYISYKIFLELLHLPGLWSSTLSLLIVGTIFFITPVKERINLAVRNVVLRKRTTYQKLLEGAARAVIEILDLNLLFEYLLRQINNSLGATKIAIFLLDEETKDDLGQPVYRLAAKYGLENIKSVYLKNYKIINWLKKHNEPFLLDIAWYTMLKEQYKEFTEGLEIFNAVIVVPITYKAKLIGIMTLDQKKVDGTVFDMEDIEILKALSDQLAIAIQNSRLYKDLDDAYLQITRALALTLESKEEYLIGHSDNVTKYAVMLAKKVGLSEKDIFIITQASMLHDLGKIGIHDYILNKPDKLTKEEWEEVKQHPIKGAKILEPLPFLKEVSEIVRSHHEHYDGTGYPDGLKGEQIPFNARLLTIADCVDAMFSKRPYREKEKLNLEEVVEELNKNKGTHFDPMLTEKFLELMKENPKIFTMHQEDVS